MTYIIPPEGFKIWTPVANRLLGSAQNSFMELRFYGNESQIDCCHFLLGMLQDESCSACYMMKILKVPLKQLKQDIIRSAEKGNIRTFPKPFPMENGLSNGVKFIIPDSFEEAKNFNHTLVGTHHLLMAMCKLPENEQVQIFLTKFNINELLVKDTIIRYTNNQAFLHDSL